MYFDSFADLLAMGGYATSVWTAFGITFLSMFILLFVSIRKGFFLLIEMQTKLQLYNCKTNIENIL
ncbi:heme exporter protein D [Candidatus Photodesmus katoptron]|uniref:Heme exporter protein D n=1 Tax=Candidatus Photodesmus katoptron Akat1 TaxID=1236703 RepID=S3DJ13_9GAMM|nr:heme exporter protein CcmD [Candidatus Photodesmus katoptron]EPE37695.1 heme exporter protein CcmD [Candidatus Photodesmus katoptron Akat1]KEY90584.1 heme exporter protein D [Candidatus Photodesmus katoptron]